MIIDDSFIKAVSQLAGKEIGEADINPVEGIGITLTTKAGFVYLWLPNSGWNPLAGFQKAVGRHGHKEDDRTPYQIVRDAFTGDEATMAAMRAHYAAEDRQSA